MLAMLATFDGSGGVRYWQSLAALFVVIPAMTFAVPFAVKAAGQLTRLARAGCVQSARPTSAPAATTFR